MAGAWRVRDVAAHLLDGDLRKLSAHRDGQLAPLDAPIESYADVVALIQRLNAGGVAFGTRLSPRVLVDLLEVSGRWVSDFVRELDPDAPAQFSVAWAGEATSDNRFDTAREYTERWHHQMQMRAATGGADASTMLLDAPYFAPLIETAVRVLPHAYRTVSANEGATLVVQVSDATAMCWTLRRESGAWRLYHGGVAESTVSVSATRDSWWRLFFNALSPAAARAALRASGPDALVEPLLLARSVMV